MADIFAEVDIREIERLAREAPKALHRRWKEAFKDIGGALDNVITSQRLSGPPGLFRRTGALARSLGPAVVVGDTLPALKMTLGTTSRYARIHEHGGVIVAKGKKLAIPLGAAKTAAGVSRGGPLTYGGKLFPIRSKTGNLLLVRRIGGRKAKKSGHSFEPLFVLKDSVRIRPRLGFASTFNDVMPGLVRKHLLPATWKAAEDAAKASARR